MTEPNAVGEDELQAYLDRRLEPEGARAVEAYLTEHPEAAARMARDAEHRDALRGALRAKFEEPIPARLRVAGILAARRQRRGAALGRAAAAVLLLAGGGAGGWYANEWTSAARRATRALTAEAIDAYRTFAVEVRHPVEVRAEDKPHLVQWLSNRLERPITVPDLSGLGFRLLGGRVLPTGHVPAAQLMYADDRGARLTIYLQPLDLPGSEFRYAEHEGVRTVYWAGRGMAFAVTAQAAADRDKLLAVARGTYDQLNQLNGPVRVPAEHGGGL